MLRCFRYIFILHVLTVILYGSSTSSLHELSFHISNVFGSHMVLQANEVVSFWGWDEKGARVEVRFNNKKYTTTANVESGLWRIEFPAMKPSFVPYDITVIGSSNQMQVLEDILFGDVILCSGSSNMEFTLDDAVTGDEEAQLANKYPYIRLTSGPLQGSYDLKSIDSTPYNELGVINLPWSVASNETVVKPDQTSEWDYYSAVCWFTLRHLFDELDGKIPLGGVVQAFGGSSIQFWSSPEAIQVCGDVYQPGSSCCGYGGADSCLYHSQLAPYAVGPTKFKQIIWYQGEQNAGFGGPSQTEYYNCALPALIIDLRSKFQQPNLGFGICLLTPWQSESSPTLEFADLRQVQLKTALTIENTFIINTLDQGDPETGDIHSPFKLRVGIRAAQGTLSVAYGRKDIQYRGPQIRASDIIIEPPVAITRTQQHITNKIVPTLSRALLSFSVQQQSQKTNPIKNDNRDSENSIDGRSVIDSEAKLYLNSSVVCPPSLNIRGCESFAVLTADCMWISVEMSPVSVTRKLPVTDSTTLPGEADGTDGADTEATSRQVTIVRTLAAHLENNIVVLSLHTHFHLAGSMSSDLEPISVNVTVHPEGTIVGVRGMYSDWPVTQLTDSGGSPADPFILPALAQNQCVTVSARATTSGDGISGDGDESLPDGLIAIVRGS